MPFVMDSASTSRFFWNILIIIIRRRTILFGDQNLKRTHGRENESKNEDSPYIRKVRGSQDNGIYRIDSISVDVACYPYENGLLRMLKKSQKRRAAVSRSSVPLESCLERRSERLLLLTFRPKSPIGHTFTTGLVNPVVISRRSLRIIDEER